MVWNTVSCQLEVTGRRKNSRVYSNNKRKLRKTVTRGKISEHEHNNLVHSRRRRVKSKQEFVFLTSSKSRIFSSVDLYGYSQTHYRRQQTPFRFFSAKARPTPKSSSTYEHLDYQSERSWQKHRHIHDTRQDSSLAPRLSDSTIHSSA